MHYLIDAHLENGIPHITIRDADTGRVRLRWARADASDRAAGQALHGLFKDLVLLSCGDKLNCAEQARRLDSVTGAAGFCRRR